MKAYSLLSNLLSVGNIRTEKGQCKLYKSDVYSHLEGMKFIIIPPTELNEHFCFEPSFIETVKEYKAHFGNNVYLAATRYQGDDAKYIFRLAELSEQCNVPMVATNDVHYHHAER